jgi:hypothetical protein
MATMLSGIIITATILFVIFLCISLFSKINEACSLGVEACFHHGNRSYKDEYHDYLHSQYTQSVS